ncbi:Ca-activated chloride channel homolog [Gammaproteobacteria bacterium]
MMSAFHFLRPLWLLALPPLAVLLWRLWRQRLTAGSWRAVVDPRLLPYLILGSESRQRPWPLFAMGIGGLLAILALAGPVWQKLEQPVFRQQSALIVLLDLSRSMDAADLKPNRLERARLKLQDILRRRREGQTALVVFAAQPFVVSPLTDDTRTIASQVPSLSTDLMPEQGARPDHAIDLAHHLLKQAGAAVGTVLLIGDGVDGVPPSELNSAIDRLVADGYRLALLGVGSAEGAPIPLADGGFFKDASGAIVLPRLDEAALTAVARRAHGLYHPLRVDDSDVDALLNLVDSRVADAEHAAEGLKSDQWREEGPWLLLPLLVLGTLAFRRGYLMLLIPLLLPLPRPAQALDWQSLWQRPDQRAQQVMDAGNPTQAAELFQDPKWRAAAKYRTGDYQAALDALKGNDDPDSLYNQGNALAQLGRLPEAVATYDEAIKRAPSHQDAAHNRDLVKKFLEQQKKDKNQSQQGDKGDKGNKGDKDNKADNQKTDQQKGDQQKGEQQKDQAQSDPKDSGNQPQGQSGEKNQADRSPSAQSNPLDQSNQSAQSVQPPPEKPDTSQSAAAQAGKDPTKPEVPLPTETDAKQLEQTQANEQWLRRIPDDPGGLWRRKFLYQYRNQHSPQGGEQQPW